MPDLYPVGSRVPDYILDALARSGGFGIHGSIRRGGEMASGDEPMRVLASARQPAPASRKAPLVRNAKVATNMTTAAKEQAQIAAGRVAADPPPF
jgi:hypothetical protein